MVKYKLTPLTNSTSDNITKMNCILQS